MISSLHRARLPLSHIHVCDERVLASPRAVTLQFSSTSLWVWFLRWQQCANRHSIISVKLGSFVNIWLTFGAAPLLVQALVTSKFYYCNSLLYGLPKNVIKQLQRVQNAAALVVTISPKFCHITPVLANLHWLPIDLRIEFKILNVTYKTLHWLAPAYNKDPLQSYHSAWDLRSSKKNLLAVPAFNIKSYGRRAFSVSAPLLWNSLPRHIRDAGSLDFFERQLKTALFKRAFLNWWLVLLYLKLFYL